MRFYVKTEIGVDAPDPYAAAVAAWQALGLTERESVTFEVAEEGALVDWAQEQEVVTSHSADPIRPWQEIAVPWRDVPVPTVAHVEALAPHVERAYAAIGRLLRVMEASGFEEWARQIDEELNRTALASLESAVCAPATDLGDVPF